MADGAISAGLVVADTITTTATSQVAIATWDLPLSADIHGRVEFVLYGAQDGPSYATGRLASRFRVVSSTLTVVDTTPLTVQYTTGGTNIGSPTFAVAAVSNDLVFRVTPANATYTRWCVWIYLLQVEEDFA